MDVTRLDATFSQGIIVNLTLESNTILIASTSCLKLNSKLLSCKKLFPPSQITSILLIILGLYLIARATLVNAPIANM